MFPLAILTAAIGLGGPSYTPLNTTTEVTGAFTIPGNLEEFKGVVEIRLYQYDRHSPFFSDARQIGESVLMFVNHKKETLNRETFRLGKEGTLDTNAGYYLTVLVHEYDGTVPDEPDPKKDRPDPRKIGRRTHIGELPGGVGLIRVLTDDFPRYRVEVMVREIRR